MIEMTVALPMYRSKDIAWLALESLCRQKDVDFEWELIVIEEMQECFSEKKLITYSERLKNAGCQRIFYKQIHRWIPLYIKWKKIAEEVSPTSKAFLLKAADCYSQPYRLRETYDLMVKRGYDWVASQQGAFYDIKSELLVIYDGRQGIVSKFGKKGKTVGGLNMAIKPHFIKEMPYAVISRRVDTAIIKAAREICKDNKSIFRTVYNESDNWKYGVDTNGLNNISSKRLEAMKSNPQVFKKTDMTIEDILPEDVVIKLKSCKKFCRQEYVEDV